MHSISAGLGRPVEASAVELELFPLPGFVLHNLTVGEDPAYGAEPVMMAQTVTASLRASTLWHARVEIASLRFDAPSVNLVRNAQGHWNVESLLRSSPALRSRSSSMARGSSGASNPMPFPYVEATDARVNFKLGPEKLPFSLESADLAVWKESASEWRLRIKARPVRTDLTVEDAGQIRGQGTLRTGGVLTDAPIQASLEWRRVQLGEISRLLHGEDDGWRGTMDWTAKANGTLANVSLTSDLAVEEFRRAEFVPPTEMDLSAHCRARYARNNPPVDALQCSAPVGEGQLLLRGTMRGRDLTETGETTPVAGISSNVTRGNKRTLSRGISERPQPHASIKITLHHAPASFFLDLLGHIHPGVVSDATASGEVNGEADCDWQGLDTLSACTGEIRSTELHLHLANLDRPLTLSSLMLVSPPAAEAGNKIAAPTTWNLLPTHVTLGGATPATITGTISSTGSALQITGAADLAELSGLAQSLKIPAISGEVQSIRGSAQLALSFESSWLPRSNASTAGTGDPTIQAVQPMQPGELAASRWTGSLQVHNATLKIASLPLSLQLASAQVNLTPTGVEWTGLEGTFAHIPFDGNFQWQTPCRTSKSACARTFILHTPNLNAELFQAALHQGDGASQLLNLINPWAGGSPPLPEVSGTLNADLVSAGRISLKNVSMKLRMEGHSAELLAITGRIFGGTLERANGPIEATAPAPDTSVQSGAGSVQWGNGAPVYMLRTKLERIQPNSVAAIWHEHWGRGTVNMEMDLKTQGWSAADLAQNASGKFSVAWLNGALSASIAAPSPSATAIEKFQRWNAEGTIRDGTLVLGSSEWVPQSGSTQGQKLSPASQSVTGTITFGRVLDLKLHPSGISITGLLDLPVVTRQASKEQTR